MPDAATLNSPQSTNIQEILVGRKHRSFSGFVGGSHLDDYYGFQLRKASHLNLKLNRLKANTDLAVLDDQGNVLAVSDHQAFKGEAIRLDLAPGHYTIRVHATEGNTSYRLTAYTKGHVHKNLTPSPVNNPVVDWNAVVLKALAADKTAPPSAARDLAIVQTAVYDAVNSILHLAKSYSTTDMTASIWASPAAAVSGAAYESLIHLFPKQKETFDAFLSQELGQLSNGRAKQDGVQVGVAVADRILALRSNDGSNNTKPYTSISGLGYWEPTPPSFAAALAPNWGSVTPFAMTSVSQFAPPPPPAYNSAQYAAELEQVRQLGQLNSPYRTTDQTQIAEFWADPGGTFTPPGHWNAIAESVAQSQKTNLFNSARLFALLDIALADAGLLCWSTKYTYNQWRPVTAIRDTTPGLPWTPDPTWTPQWATPPFPDYMSGHSTFSAAASTVLAGFWGTDQISFTSSIASLPGVLTPGVTRSYSSFSQAAQEAGVSRIYGGIHVMSSNLAGLDAGRELGSYIVQNFLTV